MDKQRISVGLLTASVAAVLSWNVSEGFTDKAVIPTTGDVPTIGYGSTQYEDGRPVKMGDVITRERAAMLAQNLRSVDEQRFAASLPGVELYQVEFDLYMNFVGQYGIGAWRSSPMRADLLAGRYVDACEALLEYRFMTSSTPITGWEPYKFNSNGAPTRWRFDCKTPGNKVCRGVWTRQQERHRKCMEVQE